MENDPFYPLRQILTVVGDEIGAEASTPQSAAEIGFLLGICLSHESITYAALLHTQLPDQVRADGAAAAASYLRTWPFPGEWS